MPRPVVHDPRQNHHGWWGTLTVAEDENGVQSDHGLQLESKDPHCLHVFLKTSKDAHFVAQGTAVDSLEFLGSDTSGAMEKLERLNETEDLGLGKEVLDLIRADLKDINTKGDLRFYIIRAIDYKRSTALARVLSLTTEACFKNDHWLSSAGEIGRTSIELGRDLKRLQPKGSMSMSPTE